MLDRIGDAPVHLVAAGKAAWPMATAMSGLLGDRLQRCVLAGQHDFRAGVRERWAVFTAGHPVPNEASADAGQSAIETARNSGDAWLVVLLSGGASAMLAVPAPPLTLDQKIDATSALLRAGTPIDRLNCVRKHLSAIKGGQLAAAAARSLTLAISDVHAPVPDDPSVIGSGPTVADSTTFADALEVVRSVEGFPDAAVRHLKRGSAGGLPETIKPSDQRLATAHYAVIGNRQTAMAAAAAEAASLGYVVEVLPDPVTGEARHASLQFVRRAYAIARNAGRPLCVIASGETTVHVSGDGLGGRNQEFALAAIPLIAGIGRAALLAAAGTDGIDGPTDAAGAIVDSSTLERAQRAGLDWEEALRNNDAYRFFEPLGDLVKWGATGTNVGDLQVMLIA
jgi:glycerate 2-kinase